MNQHSLLTEDIIFMTRRDVRIFRRDSQNPPEEPKRPSCLLKHRNSLKTQCLTDISYTSLCK